MLSRILKSAFATMPHMPACAFTPTKYVGKTFNEMMALRKQYMSPAILTYYKNPIYLVQGKMQYLWDEKGKRYLDFHGGVATVSVGHCNDRIVKVATKQLETFQHTSHFYLNKPIIEYCEKLAKTLPPGFESIYLVNSGSEANDMAVFLTKLNSGSEHFISL